MSFLHDLRMSGERDVEHESGVTLHYGEDGNSITANGVTISSNWNGSSLSNEHLREYVKDILDGCRDDKWQIMR